MGFLNANLEMILSNESVTQLVEYMSGRKYNLKLHESCPDEYVIVNVLYGLNPDTFEDKTDARMISAWFADPEGTAINTVTGEMDYVIRAEEFNINYIQNKVFVSPDPGFPGGWV